MTSSSELSGKEYLGERSELSELAIVTVTYNPDTEVLCRQLSEAPTAALTVLVDNASRTDLREAINRLAVGRHAIVLHNDTNIGLAAAINLAATHVRLVRPSCRYLLLLDQDSEPGRGGIARLLARYKEIESHTGKACCVGPRLVDVETGLEYGFHQMRGWCWSRTYPPPGSRAPVPLANLNGSGTLMPLTLFEELLGLEEDLFIDHVDTEWAFRVLAAGYRLYGVPDVSFGHRMGENSLRFWFLGWRIWPDRAPLRHYYLFRNAVRLMNRTYVPRVWKSWALVKLGLTLLVYVVIGSNRRLQVSQMAKGVKDGLHLARVERRS